MHHHLLRDDSLDRFQIMKRFLLLVGYSDLEAGLEGDPEILQRLSRTRMFWPSGLTQRKLLPDLLISQPREIKVSFEKDTRQPPPIPRTSLRSLGLFLGIVSRRNLAAVTKNLAASVGSRL